MKLANIHRKKFRIWFIFFCLLFVAAILCGISMGASSVSITRIIPTFLGQGTFKEEFVLFSVRLPRVIILALGGLALAAAGTIFQSVTRNDLADPGVIGVNAGAGVGVTVFYLFASTNLQQYVFMLPIAAFLGALLTVGCIYLFSFEKGQGIQPFKLVLVGVGFATALSGLMVLLMSTAERADVQFISKWLVGNIWGIDWPYLWALLPWFILCLPILFYKVNVLNVLSMKESTAIGLGVNLNKERVLLLFLAVALAGSAVAVTGAISFIGLMASHIAKKLIGPKHQYFLPVALLIGATLLVIADTIGRILLSSATIPAGLVVAFIGAPYFIFLLIRNK